MTERIAVPENHWVVGLNVLRGYAVQWDAASFVRDVGDPTRIVPQMRRDAPSPAHKAGRVSASLGIYAGPHRVSHAPKRRFDAAAALRVGLIANRRAGKRERRHGLPSPHANCQSQTLLPVITRSFGATVEAPDEV